MRSEANSMTYRRGFRQVQHMELARRLYHDLYYDEGWQTWQRIAFVSLKMHAFAALYHTKTHSRKASVAAAAAVTSSSSSSSSNC